MTESGLQLLGIHFNAIAFEIDDRLKALIITPAYGQYKICP